MSTVKVTELPEAPSVSAANTPVLCNPFNWNGFKSLPSSATLLTSVLIPSGVSPYIIGL